MVMCVVKGDGCFFFQAEDGIRDRLVTGVQTCALPIFNALMLPIIASIGLIVALQITILARRR